MKVIDLLNMVANGEIDEDIKYQFSNCDYCTIREFFNRYIVDEENLNLEIIGDTSKEDKKIEKLKEYVPARLYLSNNNYDIDLRHCLEKIGEKINEIIDKVNGEDNE